jgi:hypothetical protein
MWRKLLRGDNELTTSTNVLDDKTQRELDEWNAYLAKVHGREPLDVANPPIEGRE